MQTIFLDRDGVINRNRPRGDYVKSWEEFQFLPGARDAIARLTKAGFRLLIITNQAYIGKGIVSWTTVQEIHARMMQEIALVGGQIEAVLCCPHLVENGCDCRKPAPGLILKALRDLNAAPESTFVIGDSAADMEAARAAGCSGLYVGPPHPSYTAIAFSQAAERIMATIGR